MIHALLGEEMEEEMAATRAALERVPGDKLSWKPHEKSMSLGRLAGHLAEMPAYFAVTVELDGPGRPRRRVPAGVRPRPLPRRERRRPVSAVQ